MLPILVTGATGRLGRAVVDQLVNANANVPVRALTRRPNSAELPTGVEIVSGDFTVPESLDAALDGVGTVFLLWTAPPSALPAALERLARVRRIVFLSSPHQTPHPFFQQPNPMAALHADIERRIAGTGLESTLLRPGIFASNALHWWAASIREHGVVRWPYGKAETAPLDERDLASVAARVLIEDGHEGKDYVLTGPESLSQADQVRVIGAVLARHIRFEELSPDEFRRETAGSWPSAVVDMLLAAWDATVDHPAYVTSTVSDVIGSPARTFRQWATDHVSAFAGARNDTRLQSL